MAHLDAVLHRVPGIPVQVTGGGRDLIRARPSPLARGTVARPGPPGRVGSGPVRRDARQAALRAASAVAERARKSTYCALTAVDVMCAPWTSPPFERSSMVASKLPAGTMKLMTPVRIGPDWSVPTGFAWASVPAM